MGWFFKSESEKAQERAHDVLLNRCPHPLITANDYGTLFVNPCAGMGVCKEDYTYAVAKYHMNRTAANKNAIAQIEKKLLISELESKYYCKLMCVRIYDGVMAPNTRIGDFVKALKLIKKFDKELEAK